MLSQGKLDATQIMTNIPRLLLNLHVPAPRYLSLATYYPNSQFLLYSHPQWIKTHGTSSFRRATAVSCDPDFHLAPRFQLTPPHANNVNCFRKLEFSVEKPFFRYPPRPHDDRALGRSSQSNRHQRQPKQEQVGWFPASRNAST
jgi:hypothetical protein